MPQVKTAHQVRSISAMLRELGITHDGKETLLLEFTKGRSVSRSDLTYKEAEELEQYLRSKLSKPGSFDKVSDTMRKKILSCFHQMGYRKNGKIDMPRVQQTILKYGYMHISLNDYDQHQLPTLVYQVERMLDDFLTKAN